MEKTVQNSHKRVQMAKKSLKQQSKRPSTANVGHLATEQSSSQPTSNSGVDTNPPAVTLGLCTARLGLKAAALAWLDAALAL